MSSNGKKIDDVSHGKILPTPVSKIVSLNYMLQFENQLIMEEKERFMEAIFEEKEEKIITFLYLGESVFELLEAESKRNVLSVHLFKDVGVTTL